MLQMINTVKLKTITYISMLVQRVKQKQQRVQNQHWYKEYTFRYLAAILILPISQNMSTA